MIVQPENPKVYKTIIKHYPSPNYAPQSIFHKEFINNFRYEGTLRLAALNRNSSDIYVATYNGYIYKTPILEN